MLLGDEINEKVLEIAKSLGKDMIKEIEKYLEYQTRREKAENAVTVEYKDGRQEKYYGKNYKVDFSKMTQEEAEGFVAALKAMEQSGVKAAPEKPDQAEVTPPTQTVNKAKPITKAAAPPPIGIKVQNKFKMADLEKKYTAKAVQVNAARAAEKTIKPTMGAR